MARWLETTTGWSIRRLITTARRYSTITISIAGHTLTAADPLPPDLTQALSNIHHDTETLNEPTQVKIVRAVKFVIVEKRFTSNSCQIMRPH